MLKIIHEEGTKNGCLQIVCSNTKYGTRHYWRTLAKNGEELARSSENYERLQGCLRNLRAEKELMADITPVKSLAAFLGIKL